MSKQLQEVIDYFNGYGSPHDDLIIDLANEAMKCKGEIHEIAELESAHKMMAARNKRLEEENADLKQEVEQLKGDLQSVNNQYIHGFKIKNSELEKTIEVIHMSNQDLQNQNVEMAEVLRFYADEKTYERRQDMYEPLDTDINDDRGKKAREVLRKLESER